MTMSDTLPASLARLPVTLRDIETAARHLAGLVKRTSFDGSRTLSDITGADVWLKFENLQFTASFKERGALNKLLSLTAEQRSAAYRRLGRQPRAGRRLSCARLGIPATIVMPEGTPFVKIEHTAATARMSSKAARRWRKPCARLRAWPQGRPDLRPSLRRSDDHRRPGHRRARDAGGGARPRCRWWCRSAAAA